MKIAELKNISFWYERDKIIFNNINTQINSWDFIWVFWENGKWKTTIIKILLWIIKQNSWEINWFDKYWKKSEKNIYNIEYISQKASNLDSIVPITVKEVVKMWLYNNNKSSNNHKSINCWYDTVETALKHVNMFDFINKPFREISGWQQQRILIAKSLIANPDIIIMDEPTSWVDMITQKHFYDLLYHINKKHNITILIISHDLQFLEWKIEKIWYVWKSDCDECNNTNLHLQNIKNMFQKQSLEFLN